jgi:prepilin-type N-terminal cleavage/methylation domain-containing protein
MLRRTGRQRAFTLVELLAVIAIMTLLMGILLPAIGAARDAAKKAKTGSQLNSLGAGCEMFHEEMGKYPRSSGPSPFADTEKYLSGAQWLVIQLAGPDLRGYVKPITRNDTNDDGVIDDEDWNAWYALDSDYPRVGPYINTDGEVVVNAAKYRSKNPRADYPAPDQLEETGSGWEGGQVPFFIDSFNYPILYYRANDFAKKPFTTSDGVGVYDQSDNGVFTGAPGGNQGRDPTDYDGWDVAGNGWDLSGGANVRHPMGVIGWDPNSPNDPPQRDPSETFASVVYDQNIFETTQRADQGRVWPFNANKFILVSPGKDGLYGTADDVQNFQSND